MEVRGDHGTSCTSTYRAFRNEEGGEAHNEMQQGRSDQCLHQFGQVRKLVKLINEIKIYQPRTSMISVNFSIRWEWCSIVSALPQELKQRFIFFIIERGWSLSNCFVHLKIKLLKLVI